VPAPERRGWDVTAREVDAKAENNTNHIAISNPTAGKGEYKKPAKIPECERVYPPLPLSARRDAGHVIFRGDQKVEIGMDEVNEVGDGVFAV